MDSQKKNPPKPERILLLGERIHLFPGESTYIENYLRVQQVSLTNRGAFSRRRLYLQETAEPFTHA